MGVPTPAPGVGTFRTPLTGASRTPERTVGPLISVRRRRGERSGGKTLGQGRTDWPSRADLTYSGTDVNSVRLPGVMLTRDGEQSPDPWPSIQRGDYVAAKGGTGAVGPGDEEPESPAQAARADTADRPAQAGRADTADRPASPPPAGAPPVPDPPASDSEQPDPRRIATQADFGRELTLVRQRAGLTVREVARAVGIPASTTGDYFAGRHLPPPSQPGLLARILRACGETDPAELSEWVSALNRIRRGPGRRPAAATAPYRGLASFQPEDAPWFFGREAITARLVRLATGAFAPGVPLTVVGPSGSGKSSLLRAGLIPALSDRSQRRLALFTPGATPLGELARQLARLRSVTIEGAADRSSPRRSSQRRRTRSARRCSQHRAARRQSGQHRPGRRPGFRGEQPHRGGLAPRPG